MSFSAPVYCPRPVVPAWTDGPDRSTAGEGSAVCPYKLHSYVRYAPGGSKRRADPADKRSAFPYRSNQHRWYRRRQGRTLQDALDRADGEEVHRNAALAIADARADAAARARERQTAPRPHSAPRVVCSHGCEPTVVGSHTSSWYEPQLMRPSPGPATSTDSEEPGQRWPSSRAKQRYWAPGIMKAVSAVDLAGAMDVAETAKVRQAAHRRTEVRRRTKTGRGSPPLLSELGPSPSSPPVRMVLSTRVASGPAAARARLSDIEIPATPQPVQARPAETAGRSSPPVEMPESPPDCSASSLFGRDVK